MVYRAQKPLVICNEEHRFVVAEQLLQLDKLAGNIILEPVGRNTAPAVALAALKKRHVGRRSVAVSAGCRPCN